MKRWWSKKHEYWVWIYGSEIHIYWRNGELSIAVALLLAAVVFKVLVT